MKKFFKKIKNKIFLTEKFSKLKKKRFNFVVFVGGVVVIFLIVIAIALQDDDKEPARIKQTVEEKRPVLEGIDFSPDQKTLYHRATGNNVDMVSYMARNENVQGAFQDSMQKSQIIENKEKDARFALLPGTLIPAITLNKVVSSSMELPVLATVTSDVYHPVTGDLAISSGSKLIGSASYDADSGRVQVYFKTLVTQEQQKFSLSGLALDKEDGVGTGLSGRYHSQYLQKIAGTILSTFIGGVTRTLQDQTTSPFGINIKESSLKNALLEGATDVSLSQAQNLAQNLGQSQGYVEVPQGTEIFVFLTSDFYFSH